MEEITNVDIRVGITEVKEWNADAVIKTCGKNKFYTCGDNRAYEKMLKLASRRPTISNIYFMAKDIYNHSSDEVQKNFTIEDIMAIINREVVVTTYETMQEVISDEPEGENRVEVKVRVKSEPKKEAKAEPKQAAKKEEAKPKVEAKPKSEVKPKPEAKATKPAQKKADK